MLALIFAAPALRAEGARPTPGERLALDGRCAAAMPVLEQELAGGAMQQAGARARVAWRLGQCRLRLKEYAAAADALQASLEADAAQPVVQLDLARAHYHAGHFADAELALGASDALSERALWQLYRGLVSLAQDDAATAVTHLERAVEMNASGWQTGAEFEPVEPVASYYLGLALSEAGEAERARSTLRGVAENWAGTEWADEAGGALEDAAGRRAFLTLGTGVEYDDNVVLLGRDTPLPQNISNEGSFRSVYTARGGIDLFRRGALSSGLLGSYRGRTHYDRDLGGLDSHFATASLWANQALGATTHLRGTYDFGHAWVDGDAFLLSHAGQLALLQAWSPRQTTGVYARVYRDDFDSEPRDDITTDTDESQRDRDGLGLSGGVAHSVVLPLRLAWLTDPAWRLGYFFADFDAEGVEYTHQSHRGFAGVTFTLPQGITLDGQAGLQTRNYRGTSTFRNRSGNHRSRRDRIVQASARLTVPLVDPVSLGFSYRFRNQHSSVDVFDYAQHVAGVVLNVRFARKR